MERFVVFAAVLLSISLFCACSVATKDRAGDSAVEGELGTVSDFDSGTGSDAGRPDSLGNGDDTQTSAGTVIDTGEDTIDTQGDPDSGVDSDSTPLLDGDSDGLPDDSDPCPEDAANSCVDNGTGDYGAQPVFDFDGDGCLPSAGYDENGDQNGGLSPTGSITGGCRDEDFLDSSHTLHRYACLTSAGSKYCGHFYALYFEKDQVTILGGGHRHDWEYAAVWMKDGVVTHGSASAHGDLDTKEASGLDFEGSHLKIVYHKDGGLTHAFRFAKDKETAENPYGKFVTPRIESWYELTAGGFSNEEMRERLNAFDYGKATIPLKDSNFLQNLNEFRPSDYPEFTWESVEASNPSP